MDLLEPNYLDYIGNFPQQIMDAMTFTPDHIMNIVAMVLCCTFGYLLYTVAGEIYKKDKVDPYPVFLHCWMVTIDVIGTITFWLLLAQNFSLEAIANGAWVFLFFSIGLPVWMSMEITRIYHDIKDPEARRINFGKLVKDGKPTEAQARFWCLGMIGISFFVNMYALSMLGGFENAAIFIVWPFTNYVFALWTRRFWNERATELGTRKYQAMKLHIVIVIQISLMWVPGLSWYLALIPFLHTIWYYLDGIAMTALAVYNLYKCSQLPEREPLPDGTKPVW